MQRSSRPFIARLIMAVAAVGLFIVGYQWGNQFQTAQQPPLRIDGVLLRPPVELPELDLHGPQGPFSRADLDAQWSLIAFGSPGSAAGHRGVSRLIEIANRVADQPDLRKRLQLLLISADDAPTLARDFEQLTPSLRVLSTPEQRLAELKTAVGAGQNEPAEAADGPPPLFLVDPRARLVALFAGGQPAAKVADDLKMLSERPEALVAVPESADTAATNHPDQ
ncbi:hypothetical protein U5801_12060 [Lamprobacter modestohalophilus]|uniref:hypothetical protein n=1 Tax=Lamprobacter modestohalophilus TaxID=1064514 RepID=UPI002ADEFA0C|nr:hypothetical protein [Lamprobacter modestohalophilus]MEA1050537.1 hypothetical protein [Lamprobacter modestohalophilus]